MLREKAMSSLRRSAGAFNAMEDDGRMTTLASCDDSAWAKVS